MACTQACRSGNVPPMATKRTQRTTTGSTPTAATRTVAPKNNARRIEAEAKSPTVSRKGRGARKSPVTSSHVLGVPGARLANPGGTVALDVDAWSVARPDGTRVALALVAKTTPVPTMADVEHRVRDLAERLALGWRRADGTSRGPSRALPGVEAMTAAAEALALATPHPGVVAQRNLSPESLVFLPVAAWGKPAKVAAWRAAIEVGGDLDRTAVQAAQARVNSGLWAAWGLEERANAATSLVIATAYIITPPAATA